jgi:hypothetical protein
MIAYLFTTVAQCSHVDLGQACDADRISVKVEENLGHWPTELFLERPVHVCDGRLWRFIKEYPQDIGVRFRHEWTQNRNHLSQLQMEQRSRRCTPNGIA